MKRAVVILSLLSCAVEAQAKVYPACPDPATQSEGGAWMDQDGLQHCLKLDDAFRLLTQRFDILESEMDLKVQQIAEQIVLEGELNDKLTMLENAREKDEAEIDRLQEQVQSWYRNPWLLGSLGFCAGVVSSGIILIVVHH